MTMDEAQRGRWTFYEAVKFGKRVSGRAQNGDAKEKILDCLFLSVPSTGLSRSIPFWLFRL